MRNHLKVTCVFVFLFAVGCADAPGPVHMTEVGCRLNSDCELGEYCDSFTSLCGWDCRSDSECELGMYCRLDTGRCEREDVPPIDPGPELEIEVGSLEDRTLVVGSEDAEIVRFDVCDRSDRPMLVVEHSATISRPFFPVEPGDFTDIKFVDGDDFRVVMGPTELLRERGGDITLTEAFTLSPGECRTLVMRVDVGSTPGTFRFVLGASSLLEVIYADTMEPIPAERMLNNEPIARVIEVIDPAAMPAGDAVLLYNFEGRTGNRSERDAYHPLGTLTLTAVGGSVDFEGVTLSGLPFDGFDHLRLSREGRIEGPAAATIGSFLNLRLTTPVRLAEGESISYEVWGMLTPTSRGFEFTMRVIGLDAYAVGDDSLTIARLGDGTPTRIRVWTTYPVITPQRVSATAIINRARQELYRVQVGSSEAAARTYIGSLTFGLSGLNAGRTLSDFRVRSASTKLFPDAYRVIRTYDGADLENGTLEAALTAQVTVIFDPPLEVSGSGTLLTLTAEPNGFVAGDSLQIRFGDRGGTYDTMNGVLNADGTLSFPEVFGDASWVDCVVWSDSGVRWTGTWSLENITEFTTLTL